MNYLLNGLGIFGYLLAGYYYCKSYNSLSYINCIWTNICEIIELSQISSRDLSRVIQNFSRCTCECYGEERDVIDDFSKLLGLINIYLQGCIENIDGKTVKINFMIKNYTFSEINAFLKVMISRYRDLPTKRGEIIINIFFKILISELYSKNFDQYHGDLDLLIKNGSWIPDEIGEYHLRI